MLKILLAVDGSESAIRANRNLVESASWYKEPIQVELVTVHLPLPPVGGFAGAVVKHEMVERYYSEERAKALAPSRKLLDDAGVRYTPHILIDQIAQSIVEHAQKSGCQMIYMGARGMTAIANVALGSVVTRTLHLAHIPVVLIH